MIKKIKAFTITFLLLLTSCSNFLEHEADDIKNSIETEESSPSVESRKTYLSINIGNKTASRTIRPQNISIDKLTNFTLYGTAEGQELLGAPLMSAPDSANLPDRIEITPGHWAFSLTANYGSAIYAAQTEVDIIPNIENHIAFVLKPQGEWGSFSLTVDLSSNTEISKVNAKLQTVADEDIDSQVFRPEPENPVINYSQINLNPGTYMVSFEFFGDENDPTPIDNWESYIIIKAGTITEDTINLDLNLLWTIDYELTGADGADGEFTGGFQITKYSARSCFDLPKGRSTTDNRTIIGWRINGEGALLTKIEPGNFGDMTLQAVYGYNELYVSGMGDNSNDGFTLETPLETIDEACNKIIANENSEVDWTIYVIGDVTGTHTSSNKSNNRSTNASAANDYGRTIIPATLTTSHAKSILITGYNEPDADGNPQDMLNRGIVGVLNSDYDNGNVLAVSTEVPVTIKNLMITRGRTASTNPNTNNDPYYVTGGGLYIAEGATVTLDDNVLIIKNKAKYGGAVYNAGTLYMVGSATIGNKNATTFAQHYVTDSSDPCSNEYSQGGGIYNLGTVYLGTSEKPLTGGIYYSYGLSSAGGGIYNKGTVEMRSGIIAYNDGSSQGGGVFINTGTFNMLGGSIYGNSTSGNGGGVYVDNGATFNFSGGTIYGNNANTGGGGVYISGNTTNPGPGKMFMYGEAVVGNSSKTTMPTTTTDAQAMKQGSNIASTGAGIYAQGYLYLGYINQTETELLSGGIYYNYNKGTGTTGETGHGGGLFISSGSSSPAEVHMNSGTIAFNYALSGSAVYANGTFYLSGSPKIPAGSDNKHDIYINNYTNDRIIKLDGALDALFSAVVTPDIYENGSTQKPALDVVDGANTDIDTERGKFEITPQVDTAANMTTYWVIDSNGKLARSSGAFSFQINMEKPTISDISLSGKDLDTNYTIYSGSSDVTRGHSVTIEPTNTAANFTNYVWSFDGESIVYDAETVAAWNTSNSSHSDFVSTNLSYIQQYITKTSGGEIQDYKIKIDTTNLTLGYHNVTVDVTRDGKYLSAMFQLHIVAAD